MASLETFSMLFEILELRDRENVDPSVFSENIKIQILILVKHNLYELF